MRHQPRSLAFPAARIAFDDKEEAFERHTRQVGRSQEEAMAFMNRNDFDSRNGTPRKLFRSPFSDRKPASKNVRGNNNKPAPPEVTNAESFYYVKQMNAKTPMVIVMTDGEEIHGCIEWYDRNCLKVNRDGAPNLLIQKHCIKYLFKADER
jgi:sRNA-binding regulator protein Hfq